MVLEPVYGEPPDSLQVYFRHPESLVKLQHAITVVAQPSISVQSCGCVRVEAEVFPPLRFIQQSSLEMMPVMRKGLCFPPVSVPHSYLLAQKCSMSWGGVSLDSLPVVCYWPVWCTQQWCWGSSFSSNPVQQQWVLSGPLELAYVFLLAQLVNIPLLSLNIIYVNCSSKLNNNFANKT